MDDLVQALRKKSSQYLDELGSTPLWGGVESAVRAPFAGIAGLAGDIEDMGRAVTNRTYKSPTVTIGSLTEVDNPFPSDKNLVSEKTVLPTYDDVQKFVPRVTKPLTELQEGVIGGASQILLDPLMAYKMYKPISRALRGNKAIETPVTPPVVETPVTPPVVETPVTPPVTPPTTPKVVAQLRAPRDENGFYSALDESALNLNFEKGTGIQFLKALQKGEKVKGEEIRFRNLEEFLTGKQKMTKQEVIDYLRDTPQPIKMSTLKYDGSLDNEHLFSPNKFKYDQNFTNKMREQEVERQLQLPENQAELSRSIDRIMRESGGLYSGNMLEAQRQATAMARRKLSSNINDRYGTNPEGYYIKEQEFPINVSDKYQYFTPDGAIRASSANLQDAHKLFIKSLEDSGTIIKQDPKTRPMYYEGFTRPYRRDSDADRLGYSESLFHNTQTGNSPIKAKGQFINKISDAKDEFGDDFINNLQVTPDGAQIGSHKFTHDEAQLLKTMYVDDYLGFDRVEQALVEGFNNPALNGYQASQNLQNALRNYVNKLGKDNSYKSGHFGDKGDQLMGWIRSHLLPDDDGVKVNLLHEDQSDIHQKANRNKSAMFESIFRDEIQDVARQKGIFDFSLNDNDAYKAVIRELMKSKEKYLPEEFGYNSPVFSESLRKKTAESRKIFDDPNRTESMTSPVPYQMEQLKDLNNRMGMPDYPYKGSRSMELGLRKHLQDTIASGSERLGITTGNSVVKYRHADKGNIAHYDVNALRYLGKYLEENGFPIEWKKSKINGEDYHYFDITPEMKSHFTEKGQPYFSLAPIAGLPAVEALRNNQPPQER